MKCPWSNHDIDMDLGVIHLPTISYVYKNHVMGTEVALLSCDFLLLIRKTVKPFPFRG